MSDSVRPHRWQPTRLPRPWDSPGKNTGVGYHFLLQCMKVKRESEVAQSSPTLSDPMDCSSPGSSIHGIFQARVLEWGAIAFSVTNLDSILKSRDIILSTKVCLVVKLVWFFQWSCMDVRVGLWRKLRAEELMLLNYSVGEDSWESLGLQGDPTSLS